MKCSLANWNPKCEVDLKYSLQWFLPKPSHWGFGFRTAVETIVLCWTWEKTLEKIHFLFYFNVFENATTLCKSKLWIQQAEFHLKLHQFCIIYAKKSFIGLTPGRNIFQNYVLTKFDHSFCPNIVLKLSIFSCFRMSLFILSEDITILLDWPRSYEV